MLVLLGLEPNSVIMKSRFMCTNTIARIGNVIVEYDLVVKMYLFSYRNSKTCLCTHWGKQ